jgi:hypothetical protein
MRRYIHLAMKFKSDFYYLEKLGCATFTASRRTKRPLAALFRVVVLTEGRSGHA